MDLTSFVMGRASAGGGGGTTPTQTKTATPTTSAQDVEPDSGYLLNKVIVGAIPSQYIVPAGKKTITENGTDIDVSQFATADVAVPSSGGSSYTLIYSGEVEDTYSGSSASLCEIDLSDITFTTGKMLYVKIRDKAGPRAGYFCGSDAFAYIYNASPSAVYANSNNVMGRSIKKTDGGWSFGDRDAGLYFYNLSASKTMKIYHKSSSGAGTIDGTYTIEVYLLDYAPNGNPFS